MPIAVICPGCKAQFRVADKFAGKQGPCPKCKAPITIPVVEEVKVHAPDEGAAAKDSKGRPVSKPITREQSKITPLKIVLTLVVIAVYVAAAYFGKDFFAKNWVTLGLGAMLVALPLTWAGYALFREDEFGAHLGWALWTRVALCALCYVALWGVFMLIPPAAYKEIYGWLLLVPMFIAAGGALGSAILEMEFTSGCFHYGLFLAASLALRALVGLEPLWASVKSFTT